ncbi:MAG: OmpH family outer membrane protein [Cytophagales bacterium]|nr:MAG: OmpH family outer membrane protein [Cytophagales bacterium]
MKKNIVVAFVAALLFGGINAQAQAQAAAPVSAAPAAAAGPLKLGYTSMDYLLSKTPEAKDIQNQLTIQRTQLENEAKRMEKEFQDKLAAYEKGGAQMSEVIRADREKELQSLQSRFQEFQRNADTQLQNKYQQLVNPVIQKIQKNIDAAAKESGYTYVFNLDAGAGTAVILLHAPEENNITDLVLKRMGITPDPPKPAGAAAPAPTTPAAPKKN